jgi:hypothetical protein
MFSQGKSSSVGKPAFRPMHLLRSGKFACSILIAINFFALAKIISSFYLWIIVELIGLLRQHRSACYWL